MKNQKLSPKEKEILRDELNRIHQDAMDLFNTSIEDMKSSLECSWSKGTLDRNVVMGAMMLSERNGEKTRAKILGTYLRKFPSV